LFYSDTTIYLVFFFFYSSPHHPDLHSFPTRRSSDLRLLLGELERPVRRRLRQAEDADPDEQEQGPGTGLREPRQQPERGDHVDRSEEHTSELQSLAYLVCRLLLEKKKKKTTTKHTIQ